MEDDAEGGPLSLPPRLPLRYVYRPLPAPNSIRLLSLHKSNDIVKEGIYCHLSTHSAAPDPETFPSYKALSYVWGSIADLCTIHVNGVPVKVTRNLHSALLELHNDLEDCLLWIDALCIDQSDLEERNSQVAMMNIIYAGAAEVILWLGTAPPDSGFPETPTRFPPNVPLPDNVLRHLSGNEWFDRCWTLQEAVLATAITVRCGPHFLRWEMLGAQVTELDMKQRSADYDPRFDVYAATMTTAPGPARMIARVREISLIAVAVLAGELSLTGALFESWSRQATNPLDKVFAVLGLFDQTPIPIDYRQSPEQLCRTATVACILKDKDLTVLELVSLTPYRTKHETTDFTDRDNLSSDTPSWILRIPEQHITKTNSTSPKLAWTGIYPSVSENLIQTLTQQPNLSILPLSGVFLGRVSISSKHASCTLLPPCAQTRTIQTLSLEETLDSSIDTPADNVDTLLKAFYLHDTDRCACQSAHDLLETQPPPHVSLGQLPPGSRAGDWLCLVVGAYHVFVLSPQGPHRSRSSHAINSAAVFQLISVMEMARTNLIIDTILNIRQDTRRAMSRYVWPLCSIAILLA